MTDDLRDRLVRAAAALSEGIDTRTATDRARIRGKIEGVRLAISYLDETVALLAPAPASETAREDDEDGEDYCGVQYGEARPGDCECRRCVPAPTPPTTVQADDEQAAPTDRMVPVSSLWRSTELLAEREAEVADLRSAVNWWAAKWTEARQVLAYVADRIDEFTYDEFAGLFDDEPVDRMGETYTTTVQADACVECRGTGDPAGAGGPDGYGHTCKKCGGTGQVDEDKHECAYDTPGAGPCETCLTTVQANRDAGQVRLDSNLAEKWTSAATAARKAEHHFPADCLSEAVLVVRHLTEQLDALAARQSDPDATERVEWGVRIVQPSGNVVSLDNAASARRIIGQDPANRTLVRRTVTTGEWTEVGDRG